MATTNQFSNNEIKLLLESLKFTKLRFEDYPIGEKGDPSYKYKQKRITSCWLLIPVKT